MRKTAFAIVILFSILLGAALASGQSPPIPHGIDGIIYTAEEPSRQVPAGTSFIINNTATGKHIQGKTGQGPLTGRYSVVIDGNDGDLLAIRAWNQLYEATKSVVLEGSMHGINLYLMTESGNSNPVIVSNPNVTATVNIAYYYKVSAQDADGDALTYQLGQAPTGMQIDAQGLVTWVPGQAGSYSVTVEVSDGQGSAQQAFIISVSGKPGSPIAFISVPVTQARVGHPYSYQASATGGEAALAYSLIQSPAGMAIGAVSGLVQWTPSGSGAYNVAIKASDG
ncbi:putative Ig domain-containing protein, partial [Candidatus Woesearchaeota archaeon]|nr:putative Ig domain-containing protein [Candidatus Woesearchaeota archaeon]